jgi:hypothetical protein
MWIFYLGASRIKNNKFFLRPRVKRQKTTMFSCIWEEKAR